MAADLKTDLLFHLYAARDAGIKEANGATCRWVMSQEWFDTVVENFGRTGMPGAPAYLLGFPLAVEADGGVPHLVPDSGPRA